jgi:hypothetical protein
VLRHINGVLVVYVNSLQSFSGRSAEGALPWQAFSGTNISPMHLEAKYRLVCGVDGPCDRPWIVGNRMKDS